MPLDSPAPSACGRYATHVAWLDCLIEREILRLRAGYELATDELRGLYISDRQVDELLHAGASPADAVDPAARLTQRALRRRAERVDDGALAQLGERCGLTPLMIDLVVIALAPEIDLRYETLYAYLNNDVACRTATVDLARRLLRSADDAGATGHAVRAELAPHARLLRVGVVEPVAAPDTRSSLRDGFRIAPIVAQFLLGLPLADPHWPAGVAWTSPPESAPPPRGAPVPRRSARLVAVVGDDPAERRAQAEALARDRGWPLLEVPVSALHSDAAAPPSLVTQLALAAALADGAVLLHDDDAALANELGRYEALGRAVRALQARVPVIWLTSPRVPWSIGLGDVASLRIECAAPDGRQRAAQWSAALADAGLPGDAASCAQLAANFRLTRARIEAAAQTVALLPERDRGAPDALRGALYAAARRHSDQTLAELATRVTRPHGFAHLVLADGALAQLRELAVAIANRERVFRQWGMQTRTGRSAGLMALFAGASGTGKTMAAAVIANTVGLDLYRVDLAGVVSKYIGETEKNLDRIFAAATNSNAIVLIDEADALLGKRAEVKDAHDRYANIEVAYLLQKMEDHDGVVILSSNLPKNLDPAFARRMHYTLEFARPNAVLRERLWRGMFPPAAPLAPDIDFRFLAQTFDTTGGEIEAVALDAAFMASVGDGPIAMEHLMRAMARRQTKQGNPGGFDRFEQHRRQARNASD
ncbi:MAG: ATP-binding protein [Burkholderiales bacterium]